MLFFSFITIIAACQHSTKNKPLSDSFDLQGHRGARGLAPENTIPAFQMALKHKMNTLEFDTVLTKDNQLIIHHDAITNPQLCQRRSGEEISSTPIRNLTVAQLKELDCGSRKNPKFPEQNPTKGTELLTLPEFFTWIRPQLRQNPTLGFNIELKFSEKPSSAEVSIAVQAILKDIQVADMRSHVTIQSFHLEALDLIAKKQPNIIRSALYRPSYTQAAQLMVGMTANQKAILKDAIKRKVQIISPYHYYVNADFVHQAHKHQIKIIPWTVNDEPRMLELFQMGIDGIISDYPDRLQKAHRIHKKDELQK